ncbi:MAG: hypothetical protein KF708_22795 [Pirellulales bacterium]|nr:hypothetical protein [Pirellulales bacterium]
MQAGMRQGAANQTGQDSSLANAALIFASLIFLLLGLLYAFVFAMKRGADHSLGFEVDDLFSAYWFLMSLTCFLVRWRIVRPKTGTILERRWDNIIGYTGAVIVFFGICYFLVVLRVMIRQIWP